MSISNKESITIVYAGEINRQGYERITKVCENLPPESPKRVDLVLSTYGGEPDAGFRIARCLQHHFDKGVSLYVPHYCKSAGTLVAIGASELVLSDNGELGPLDVQLAKSDELFERSSGMDITQGFDVLSEQAYSMFHNIAIRIRTNTRLSTKLATEAASQITVGTFAPIYAQIDPLRLGETQRATEIAYKYGNLLQEKFNNLHSNGVAKLVTGYPSHGFVIDRKEAKEIFKAVRAPTDEEKRLLKSIDVFIRSCVGFTDVFCKVIDLKALEEEIEKKSKVEDDEQPTENGTRDNSTREASSVQDSAKPKRSTTKSKS